MGKGQCTHFPVYRSASGIDAQYMYGATTTFEAEVNKTVTICATYVCNSVELYAHPVLLISMLYCVCSDDLWLNNNYLQYREIHF